MTEQEQETFKLINSIPLLSATHTDLHTIPRWGITWLGSRHHHPLRLDLFGVHFRKKLRKFGFFFQLANQTRRRFNFENAGRFGQIFPVLSFSGGFAFSSGLPKIHTYELCLCWWVLCWASDFLFFFYTIIYKSATISCGSMKWAQVHAHSSVTLKIFQQIKKNECYCNEAWTCSFR